MQNTQNLLMSQINRHKEQKLFKSQGKLQEKKDLEENLRKQNFDIKNETLRKNISSKEYRKALEEQIKNKKTEEFMTDDERKINKDLLDC